MRDLLKTVVLSICVLGLVGCEDARRQADDDDLLNKTERRDKKIGNMFGESLLKFNDKDKNSGGGIGVNQYLWRASLDTLSFMSLRSVDPFGGVIITEWYSSPENPNERIKIDVMIMDRQLRSDGIKVAMHKQHLERNNNWVDVEVNPQSISDMEDAILTRARQIKINKA